MSQRMSAESLESSIADDENRLDRISLQASLSRIEFQAKSEIISPEDIAAVAFSRIFNEDFHFSQHLSTIHEISVRKKALFSDDSESTTGRIYPKTPIFTTRSHNGQQLQTLQNPISTGHGLQRFRHKSPSNRSHNFHSSSKGAVSSWGKSDAVRKTKSTALPANNREINTLIWSSVLYNVTLFDSCFALLLVINKTWPRTTTASTPELKVDQGVIIQPLPSDDSRRENNRRLYPLRTTCYYNVRLIYIILCCFTLVMGFVYFGAAIALCVHRKLVLVVMDHPLHLSSVICLFGLACFLLTLGACGLCLARTGTKKSVAHAGFSLAMGVVLVVLAFLQSAAQLSVEVDAEFRMLSKTKSRLSAPSVWDYLHLTFKCCGVRGYLDWCQKVDTNQKIYASAADFLGSFTCSLPESCCSSHGMEYGGYSNVGYTSTSCIIAPTPSNTYSNGCLTPVLVVLSYFGKMYRVVSFLTAFILLLTATTSVTLFAYM